jgi:hypothetical protein
MQIVVSFSFIYFGCTHSPTSVFFRDIVMQPKWPSCRNSEDHPPYEDLVKSGYKTKQNKTKQIWTTHIFNYPSIFQYVYSLELWQFLLLFSASGDWNPKRSLHFFENLKTSLAFERILPVKKRLPTTCTILYNEDLAKSGYKPNMN